MQKLILFVFVILLYACTHSAVSSPPVAANAGNPPAHFYKPGLGEIMSGIQMHHAKLWYAGINGNWKLSEYEIGEIKEMLEEAKQIETDRPEVNNIPMIYGDLDSVSVAIRQQNVEQFKRGFQSLTNGCNSCHRMVNFGFNVITVPTAPPVSNQEFKPS